MLVRANGADVCAMQLTLPVNGRWVLSAHVDTDELVEGALKVEADGLTLVGTVLRSGVVAGGCRIEAVGGKGGIGKDVPARSYQGVAAKAVIGDLLAAVGETLDPSSSAKVLGTRLPYWTRAAGRAGTALSAIVEAIDARWRVLPSGAVWVGLETWPKVDEDDYDADELDRDHGAGMVLLAATTIALRPGQLLGKDRVGRVEHVMDHEAHLRTVYWTEE